MWKIIKKIVATRCHILRLNAPNSNSAGVSPDPLADFKGPTSKGREGRGGEGREGKGREGKESDPWFLLTPPDVKSWINPGRGWRGCGGQEDLEESCRPMRLWRGMNQEPGTVPPTFRSGIRTSWHRSSTFHIAGARALIMASFLLTWQNRIDAFFRRLRRFGYINRTLSVRDFFCIILIHSCFLKMCLPCYSLYICFLLSVSVLTCVLEDTIFNCLIIVLHCITWACLICLILYWGIDFICYVIVLMCIFRIYIKGYLLTYLLTLERHYSRLTHGEKGLH